MIPNHLTPIFVYTDVTLQSLHDGQFILLITISHPSTLFKTILILFYPLVTCVTTLWFLTVGVFSSWPNSHVVRCPLLLIQHIGNNSTSLKAVPTKRNWRHALQYYGDSEETLHATDRIKDMQWQHSFHNILAWMIQNIFTDHESWVVSTSALSDPAQMLTA